MPRTRVVPALLVVLALAGCQSPTAPADGPAPEDDRVVPWTSDDLELDAAVVTGEFEGLALIGFTCDITQYFGARSTNGVRPYAIVNVFQGSVGIEHHDGEGLSIADGDVAMPGAFVDSITLTAPEGYFHLSTVYDNGPWSASTTVSFTAVPIPEDGCNPADMWVADMIEVGTDPAEIVRALTDDGLREVRRECPDAWFTWVPPNMTCDEYDERTMTG